MSLKLENRDIPALDQKDIIELEENIQKFRSGQMDEEKFKLYRLTRGVYGQRQLGVQMFRIKVPYGKITPNQIKITADLADSYASSNLHLTTRQDIQLHYVKLEDSPAVWAGLTENGLTGREACGNTVRNLTASPKAGIDPEEPFDITPYAHAVAYYFLRNPICQEMGRKIKPAFSSSERDTGLTFFHDFGFIPRVRKENNMEIRGFKVVIGGGLGAQSIIAPTAHEFLPADQIIPFMEAGLRVFDRFGEREKRQKARMKFLVKELGVEGFLELVDEERKALKYTSYPIDVSTYQQDGPVPYFEPLIKDVKDQKKYEAWLRTNTFVQKQQDYRGVFLKIFLGDIKSDKARILAKILEKYASQDIRITVNQGLLLRFVHPDHLAELFTALDSLGFAEPGFDGIADITACPGTDTCNLGVTNSTGLAGKLEDYLKQEYADDLEDLDIRIKISGCMNACGQHMSANIGFHGSSIKKNDLVIPAMQIVLGGGQDQFGTGSIADKIIKLPTKKIPDALGAILDDFMAHKTEGQYFNDYYSTNDKKYFYDLLKPLADIDALVDTDLFDWGQDHFYQQEIGVGECAGVILDVVGTIVNEAIEKLESAKESYNAGVYADGLYYAYSGNVIGAKALLLADDIKCNTQIGILNDFQSNYVDTALFPFNGNFKETVLEINKQEPSQAFAKTYIDRTEDFLEGVLRYRNAKNGQEIKDKEVIGNYYKA